MRDGTFLLILLIPALLAFAFGIWVGLGYPGMYEKYESSGKAPRESPLRWLLRGGRHLPERRVLEETDEDEAPRDRTRPRFERGRRFRR